MLISKNTNEFKSRFSEVTVYNNLHIFSKFYKKTIISREPLVSASWTSWDPQTTVWETCLSPYDMIYDFIVILSSWRQPFGGDGYGWITSIVRGPLSSPLVSSMSVQLIRCPPLHCLSTEQDSLAPPFCRDRFGAGRFGAAPFRRRTFWRNHRQTTP